MLKKSAPKVVEEGTEMIESLLFPESSSTQKTQLVSQSGLPSSRLINSHRLTIKLSSDRSIDPIKAQRVKGQGLEQPESLEQGEKDSRKNVYDVWDLTHTLIAAQISSKWLISILVTQIAIRYYTLGCLIYVFFRSAGQQWEWLLVVGTVALLYLLAIVNISLKQAETKSEVILKSSFNSLENETDEYFQFLSHRKLGKSILRGLVPPELSFIYLRGNTRRRVQVYAMVNYIYASMESVIYYPFFIGYCYLITSDNNYALNEYGQNITALIAVLALLMFSCFSAFLLIAGFARRRHSLFKTV